MEIPIDPAPVVPDLMLPLPHDLVMIVAEVDIEAFVKGPSGLPGQLPVEQRLLIPAGTPLALEISHCVKTRWIAESSEWFFEVQAIGHADPLWVRVTVKSNEWSEVDL